MGKKNPPLVMMLRGADPWERWALFSGCTGLSFHWVHCYHHLLPCKPAGKQSESQMNLPNYGCALHIPYTSLFPGCVEAGCLLTGGPSRLESGKPWGQPPALIGWTGQTQMQWDMQEGKVQSSRWLMGMWHLLCARHSAGLSDSAGDLIPSCISASLYRLMVCEPRQGRTWRWNQQIHIWVVGKMETGAGTCLGE